jgi:hypothetical protein
VIEPLAGALIGIRSSGAGASGISDNVWDRAVVAHSLGNSAVTDKSKAFSLMDPEAFYVLSVPLPGALATTLAGRIEPVEFHVPLCYRRMMLRSIYISIAVHLRVVIVAVCMTD